MREPENLKSLPLFLTSTEYCQNKWEIFLKTFQKTWNLKLIFASNTFWTKIPQKSHCVIQEKVLTLTLSLVFSPTSPSCCISWAFLASAWTVVFLEKTYFACCARSQTISRKTSRRTKLWKTICCVVSACFKVLL